MAPLSAESTTFSLDNMGRLICNTLQEAMDSAGQVVGGRTRGFDTIVVGGGTFGSVVAEHLFISDITRSRRILVLEAGPYVLAEHVQNMPFVAPVNGASDMRVPWVNHPALNYAGLLFAIGGRSLTWGGWSPELLDVELVDWPAAARAELRARYFAESSRQIGVKETNDFIYGPLHTALRKQLDDGLNIAGNETGFTFNDLLDHPAVRYPDPGEPPLDAKILRDWLGLPASDTTPLAKLKELFKLEAPLAVTSTTLPGFFPTKMTQGLRDMLGDERLAGRAPMKKLGGPEDLKGIKVLLASDACAFITGQIVAVRGQEVVAIALVWRLRVSRTGRTVRPMSAVQNARQPCLRPPARVLDEPFDYEAAATAAGDALVR